MKETHPSEDRLIAFALDELEPSEREKIEIHIAGCGECRGTAVKLKDAMEAYKGAKSPGPPSHILLRLLDAQADRKARQFSWPWRIRPAAAAACAIVVLMGLFFSGFLAGRITAPTTSEQPGGSTNGAFLHHPLPEPPKIPFKTVAFPEEHNI